MKLKEIKHGVPQIVSNLHSLCIPIANGDEGTPVEQKDYSTSSGKTRVYFKDLERNLIRHISESDAVFGCVAWFTSEPIIKALSCKDVQIVVQKEDFLRPDNDIARDGWPQRLRSLYGSLHCRNVRGYEMPNIMWSGLSFGWAGTSPDPVRCVGNNNSAKSTAFPRSHHNFVVFCKFTKVDINDEVYDVILPYGVWTGSYNFTKNAGRSFENALYIEDQTIVDAYMAEYAQIFSLSEPLDWTSEWSVPEYRIGT